jgi:ATP-dependent DNA helicase DinG
MRLERKSSDAIDKFKQSKNGVLFASGALWEGIDIPGDSLSMLIIVKLPFQIPDPISEYEQTMYKSLLDYKNRVIVPEMLIKLKQGFGRLLRTETDTGCVAILDSRVNRFGVYRRRTIDSLPKCRITSCIAVIKKFFKAVKSAAYFLLKM